MRAGSRLERWALPSMLAAAGVAMAALTWGTWLDVVVDFGRELYVPWRLASGDVLYRDVAWFNGPLSPHWNALCFTLFGVGVRTLVWVNLALLALVTALLYRLLAAIGDRRSAFVACLVFLLLFAFVQLLPNGSYDWIAPYSHESTHGVLLAVAALSCLHAFSRAAGPGRAGWLALAGALLGLAFLTRASVFLAAAASSGVVLALLLHRLPAARRHAPRHALVFAVAFAVPVLLAFVLLAQALPAREALRATLGSWPSVLSGGVTQLEFYRRMTGLDAPAERLGTLFGAALLYALLLAPAGALAFVARGRRAAGHAAALAAFVAVAGLLWWLRQRVPWTNVATPLPLFVLLAAGHCALGLRRAGGEGVRAALGLGFAVLSLALLARMLLNATLQRYGFTLAAPATMLCLVAALGWVPAWIERRGGHGRVFRAAVLALVGMIVVGHLQVAAGFLARKTVRVGVGADAFWANARGRQVNRALDAVRTLAPAGATLAVLPEGAMLNYLARLPAPTPYVNYMPPELVMFGEARMRASLEASPPDLVLLVHKDTSEYGVRFFGRDYGRSLGDFLDAHYELRETFGKEPLSPGKGFGIALLVRRPERAPPR